MNIHDELHRLVEESNCHVAKEELHIEINELDEEQAHLALKRLRGTRYVLKELGFYL